MNSKRNKKNNGFVILYAVIITTVVLVVGVSLMNIMTKQLVLSSISRNAKVSYYAALSGRECAEFWKSLQKFNFNNPTYFGGEDISRNWVDPQNSSISCFNDENLETIVLGDNGVTETYFEFDFTLNGNQNACARVSVYADNNKCDEDKLLITSEGYNSTCAEIGDNPRNVKSIYRDKEACPNQ